MVDVAIQSDSNIKKKEHEKPEKYQGLKEEVEKKWELKAAVVPVVIGALRADPGNNIRDLCPEKRSSKNS